MNTDLIRSSSRVAIKPFISGQPNAGLEKYDLVVAQGAQHKELLGFIDRNGTKQYLTGLNEFAPEVQGIRDQELKDATILDIRKTVVFLENTIAGNHLITEKDIHDYDEKGKVLGFSDKFWSKVTMFISQGPDKFDNQKVRERIPTYWDSVEIKCSNQPVYLDPKNPHDLILIYAIIAGGFTIVAPSLEAARNASMEVPKFYLDREEETAQIKNELKKIRNKAGGELQRMFDKDPNKLFYVTKVCAANSLGYRKSTSNEILYNDCDMFINGETQDRNKKQTAEKFLEYCKQDLGSLRIQAILRDATEMHLLTYKQDGQLYYNKSGNPMGKGILDVIKYLENPLNEEVLKDISTEVENEWKK